MLSRPFISAYTMGKKADIQSGLKAFVHFSPHFPVHWGAKVGTFGRMAGDFESVAFVLQDDMHDIFFQFGLDRCPCIGSEPVEVSFK